MDTNLQGPDEEIQALELAKQDASIVKIFQQEDIAHLTEIMKEITSFKRKYTRKKLEITDIESKEQFEKLRLAIQVVRTKRTGLEKEKKEKTKPYRDTVEYINNAYDKATGALKSIQEPLDEIKADRDEKLLAKEKEAELKLQATINERVKMIIAAGATFDGEYYSIGSEEFGIEQVSIGMVQIGPMTGEDFELLLEQVKEKDLAINQAKEAKKQADTQKALQLQQQQELLDSQKKQQEENQKKLDDQAKAIKAKILSTRSRELKSLGFQINVQGDAFIHPSGKKISTPVVEDTEDAAWDELIAETEKIIEAEKALNELKEKRHQQLIGIGFSEFSSRDIYDYKKRRISFASDFLKDNEAWEQVLNWATNEVNVQNDQEQSQKTRYEMILPYAAFFDNKVLMNELYILSDKDFEALFNEKKTAYETKIAQDAKDLKEKQDKEKNEALAASDDKTKYADLIAQLRAITFPEMKSAKYQIEVTAIKNFLDVYRNMNL